MITNSKSIILLALFCIVLSGFFCSCNTKTNKTGSLTWELKDGTLTISGQGAMPNYDSNGGPWGLSGSEITSIIINEGVINIGNSAFTDDHQYISMIYHNVIYVSIPSSVTNIGENAFKGCSSLTIITIPEGVINIGKSAFENCDSLISIDIPDNVINIGRNAFKGCHNLLSVSLGKKVLVIGIDAFHGCYNLAEVTSSNPIPPRLEVIERPSLYNDHGWQGDIAEELLELSTVFDWSAFDSIKKTCHLVIPEEYISAYKGDTEWSKFYNTNKRPLRVNVLYIQHITRKELQGEGLIRSDEEIAKIIKRKENRIKTKEKMEQFLDSLDDNENKAENLPRSNEEIIQSRKEMREKYGF